MSEFKSAAWWSDYRADGMVGYLGHASRDGLEYRRHSVLCEPGFWRVSVTGWAMGYAKAVVDDFGNLVQVFS